MAPHRNPVQPEPSRTWIGYVSFITLGLVLVIITGVMVRTANEPRRSSADPVPTTVPLDWTNPPTLPALGLCSSDADGSKRVVVSISDQSMWACDGNRVVNSSPVTTGIDNSTPLGTFTIEAKGGPQYLTGCNASGCWHDYVHVWMPFLDGVYGFHDAPWQTMPFGSQNYTTQGSHGCVHLPAGEANWLYNWVSVGTAVTITD